MLISICSYLKERDYPHTVTSQCYTPFQEVRLPRHVHSDTGNWGHIPPHTRSHGEGNTSLTDSQDHKAQHKTGMIPQTAQTWNCECWVKLTGTETGGAIINRDRRKWEPVTSTTILPVFLAPGCTKTKPEPLGRSQSQWDLSEPTCDRGSSEQNKYWAVQLVQLLYFM